MMTGMSGYKLDFLCFCIINQIETQYPGVKTGRGAELWPPVLGSLFSVIFDL